MLAEVASNFGPLRVNSTCRSKRHNAKVGGAKRSYHLTGNAVDFRISGAVQPVLDFLTGKRMVGGLKHYGFGVFHIDTGPAAPGATTAGPGQVGKGVRQGQVQEEAGGQAPSLRRLTAIPLAAGGVFRPRPAGCAPAGFFLPPN